MPLKTEWKVIADIMNASHLQRKAQVKKIFIITAILSLSAALFASWLILSPPKHTNSTISLGSVWKDVPKSITKHCSVFSEEIIENDIYIVRDCETALYTTVNNVVLAKAMRQENGTYN